MIGQTISHYRILEKLGEGGMGVVYKAEDSRLDRTVALKFLGAHLLGDDEAKARFQREAKAAAGLHHANVCPVYEVDEADGRTFLSMAFIEGESLEDRIAKGPLPLKDALDVGRQIAEGLEAAHSKSIVHRDIKPANVMVDAKGRATIMDFGLALLTEASKLTRNDQTVGTAAYMSPEQLQGGDVDHRTDIWALGCVIYETVAGVRPFKGDYAQALAYEIVQQQPEALTGLRTGVPIELELLTAKCLAKDAGQRYQHVDELAVDLGTLNEKLKSGNSTILRTQVVAQPSLTTQHPVVISPDLAPKRKPQLAWALLAVSALLLVLASVLYFRSLDSGVSQRPLRRFALTQAESVGAGGTVPSGGYTSPVAISPDGKHIAYKSPDPAQTLWVQDLDQRNPRALEGTEGAVSPFWSPDSELIGYATTEALFKVPAQGGLPSRLCGLPSDHFHGGSWSPDGESIVFSSGAPHSLYEVPARGGPPERIVSGDEFEQLKVEDRVLWPHFLPTSAGDRVVVFSVGSYNEPTLVAQDLATGRREVLGPGAFPHYSSSGHILLQPATETYELWALPFSLDTLQPIREAFPVSQNSGFPTVAGDGTMAYLELEGSTGWQLTWLERDGKRAETVGERYQVVAAPALSPDGRHVAAYVIDGGNRDLWVFDVARGVKTRLSNDPALENGPIWSPDGDQYCSVRIGLEATIST